MTFKLMNQNRNKKVIYIESTNGYRFLNMKVNIL